MKSYIQSGYDQIKIAANEIAENLECSTGFPSDTIDRARRKTCLFDYKETVDGPLIEEDKLKIHFFNYILSLTLKSLYERYLLLETHWRDIFSFNEEDILKLKDIP